MPQTRHKRWNMPAPSGLPAISPSGGEIRWAPAHSLTSSLFHPSAVPPEVYWERRSCRG